MKRALISLVVGVFVLALSGPVSAGGVGPKGTFHFTGYHSTMVCPAGFNDDLTPKGETFFQTGPSKGVLIFNKNGTGNMTIEEWNLRFMEAGDNVSVRFSFSCDFTYTFNASDLSVSLELGACSGESEDGFTLATTEPQFVSGFISKNWGTIVLSSPIPAAGTLTLTKDSNSFPVYYVPARSLTAVQ